MWSDHKPSERRTNIRRFNKNENWCTAASLVHSYKIFKRRQVRIVLCVGTRQQKSTFFLHLLPCYYFLYGEGNRVHNADSHLWERWFLPTYKTYPEIKVKGGGILFWGKKKKNIKNNHEGFCPPRLCPPPFFFLFLQVGRKFAIQQ